MIQCCNVYINIICSEEDKFTISEWLKEYFKDIKHLDICGVPFNYLDVIDDAKELVVLDLEIDVPCHYIGGYSGSRWEPPEPAYIEDYFTETDFLDWIKFIIPCDFNVEIEIDKDSNIPTEEELVKNFKEEAMYEYDEF